VISREGTHDAADTHSDGPGVLGERSVSLAHRARSLESRISSLMAIGVMTVLGVGLLTWYYGSAVTRGTRTSRAVETAASARAQSDTPLPPIGRIALAAMAPRGSDALDSGRGEILRPAPGPPLTVAGSRPTSELRTAPSEMPPATLSLQRRLSGPAFATQMQGSSGASTDTGATASSRPVDTVIAAGASPLTATEPSGDQRSRSTRSGDIGELLKPAVTAAVSARALPNARYLLPKGAFIDCTLETAIDSTLPGMTTCITATDTFSVDGKIVLLERGSKLVGETRGQVQQGSARVFVVWTEVRTPTGVVVPLDSPGTDELGRSGLPGQVERHFWDRFGAAILISIIDSGAQSLARPSGGTLIYSPTASQDVLTEVLKGTLEIPPTVLKSQGDRIQVLVARDLDFRSVYELRALDETR
jgi:type IV secretion system protein VirB10